MQSTRTHRFASALAWLSSCGAGFLWTTGCASHVFIKGHEEKLSSKVYVRGSAECSYDEGEHWQKLESSAVLVPGCIIRTASGARVDIHPVQIYRSQHTAYDSIESTRNSETRPTRFRLYGSSVLSIDRQARSWNNLGFGTLEEMRLDLRLGSMAGLVRRLGSPWSVEVKCPKARVQIREGWFWMNHEGAVKVLVGTVDIVRVDQLNSEHDISVASRHELNPHTGKVVEMDSATRDALVTIVPW